MLCAYRLTITETQQWQGIKRRSTKEKQEKASTCPKEAQIRIYSLFPTHAQRKERQMQRDESKGIQSAQMIL